MDITCPHCRQTLEGETVNPGDAVVCPACNREFSVPKLVAVNLVAPDKTPVRRKRFYSTTKLWMFGAGFFLGIALVVKLATALYLCIKAPDGAPLYPTLRIAAVFSGILAFSAWSILHWRCWKALPDDFAKTTPGKAVGLLFVPFFRLYWFFPSIEGLGRDWHRLAISNGNRNPPSIERFGKRLARLSVSYVVVFYVVFLIEWMSGFSSSSGEHVTSCILLEVIQAVLAISGFIAWMLFYTGLLDIADKTDDVGELVDRKMFLGPKSTAHKIAGYWLPIEIVVWLVVGIVLFPSGNSRYNDRKRLLAEIGAEFDEKTKKWLEPGAFEAYKSFVKPLDDSIPRIAFENLFYVGPFSSFDYYEYRDARSAALDSFLDAYRNYGQDN